MSWTVACFCGNVYTAPPERCDVCGCSIDGADSGDLATKPAAGRRLGARPRRRARPSLPPEQVSEREAPGSSRDWYPSQRTGVPRAGGL
jgi:hypothetical protein